jgi:hypothetical protein
LRFYEAGNPFVSGPKRLLGAGAVANARKIESSATKEAKAKLRARSKRDSAATRAGAFAEVKTGKKIGKRVGSRT